MSPLGGQRATVQIYDNRIALYVAQKGKCPISGKDLLGNFHVHHKRLWSESHDDSYKNLVLLTKEVHRLVHAVNAKVIEKHLNLLQLDKEHLNKLNELRKLVGNPALKLNTQNG